MAAETPRRHNILRQALAAGKDCPPIEELARLLDPDAPPRDLAAHVAECSYCRTEIELLRVFESAPRNAAETKEVAQIVERLRSQSPPIAGAPGLKSSGAWWRWLVHAPWVSRSAIVMAMLLIAIGVGLQWRRGGAPELHAPNSSGGEPTRSGAFNVIAPLGDIREVPKEIRWQPAAAAAQYEVRMLELDRHEIFKVLVSKTQTGIPPHVQTLIVPLKTILVEVTAFDAAGRRIAKSEPARVRLLQNVYSR